MSGLFSKYHYSISALVVVIIFLFTISCKESEERKAFDFLKIHMVGMGSTEKKVVSNSGGEIHFSPYGFQTLYQAKDTLEKLIENNLLFNGYKYDLDCVPDSFFTKACQADVKNQEKLPIHKTGRIRYL